MLHGGLGPGFVSLNQIEQIERPIFSVDTETKFSQILDSILWSDPSEMIQQYTNNNRGKVLFMEVLPLINSCKIII